MSHLLFADWQDFADRENSHDNNAFNLASILQASQELSSHLEFASLLPELTRIMLANSPAKICLVILPNDRGIWEVTNVATTTEVPPEWQNLPRLLADCHTLPLKLIEWSKNNCHLIRNEEFIDQLPVNILCLPLIKKENLLGIVYLESIGIKNAFDLKVETILTFLADRGAIAIDNARLYRQARSSEIALQQSERKYQKLSENVPGVIFQFKFALDGTVSYPYISSACQDLFQVSPAAVMADSNVLLRLMHPGDIASYQQTLAVAIQTLNPAIWEGRAILASGEVKWIKSASRPEVQLDGSIVWDGVLLDITDRKKVEESLAASQQKYYNLIQSINGIVWEYDLAEDRFTFVSDRAVPIMGYPLEDWLEKPGFWQQHLHPEDRERAINIYTSSIQKGCSCEFEYRLIAANKKPIWVYDISAPIKDATGKVVGTNGLLVDISDLKEVQERLHQANYNLALTNAELNRLTRLKDEFLATMSHELRTPLNAILGISEALQDGVFGDINEQQGQYLQTIDRSGKHLLSVINDILDVSKIVAGKLELELSSVPILQLCQSSIALVKQQAIQKQIQLEIDYGDLLETISRVTIVADERRLRQVLINLLANAVKFTPVGGKVILKVEIDTANGNDDHLCLSIVDTGIGISPEDLAKLFHPFIQIDSSLNRKYEGSGLGLVLVKQIVELHSGSIDVKSELGKGSCFTVCLPHPCNNLNTPLDSNYSELPSLLIDSGNISLSADQISTVLLVEDREQNIVTTSSYLLKKGYNLLVARNGVEAISLAKNEHPDIILMDIQMPGMDGLEAIINLRENLATSTIPIVALTALAMAGDRERCLAAGANDYLTKPVKLKQLEYTIQQWLAASSN
jgi:PAS domain S-box-containing protein